MRDWTPYFNLESLIVTLTSMQRYHLPIIALAIVSTFVTYVVLTQRAPFETDAANGVVMIDVSSVAFLVIAGFLAIFSWITLLGYGALRVQRRIESPRIQTRKAAKWGILLATGICGTLLLQISDTLNIVTGFLLWATLFAVIWSTRQSPQAVN